MPADRRAGTVLVDERHRERLWIDASERRHALAQREQKLGNRRHRRRPGIVRAAEERDPTASDNTAYLEVRELGVRDRVGELRFLITADEVALIPKAVWRFRFEQEPCG